MQYKIIVDKQSRTNPSNERKEYVIDIEELRVKGDVYDSLIITKNEDYVMRRLELTKYKKLKVLEEPIKQPLQDLNIELFEGDNYIYLIDMVGNKFYAEYLIKSDFTDMYVTKSEMNSEISQTAEKIELSVNKKLTDYSTIQETQSLISQTADEIKTLVTASIGSTNLLLNSDFSNSFENWEVTDKVSATIASINDKTWLKILNSEASLGSYAVLLKQIVKPFKPKLNYTFSGKAKLLYADELIDAYIDVRLEFYDTNDNFISLQSEKINIANNKNEQTVSATFETPNNDNISYAKLSLLITANHADLLLTNLQLEIGSVVTDWNIAQTDYYSQITQKVNQITIEVGKKVGNDEIISKINQSAEAVGIEASKIELSALDVLNLLAGNTINLSSKNIQISSNNFKVDEKGKVICSDMTISGGKITLKDTGDKDEHDVVLEIQQNEKSCVYGSWGTEIICNNGHVILSPESMSVKHNGIEFLFEEYEGKPILNILNNNTGVHPLIMQDDIVQIKNPTGETTFQITPNGVYVNGRKI